MKASFAPRDEEGDPILPTKVRKSEQQLLDRRIEDATLRLNAAVEAFTSKWPEVEEAAAMALINDYTALTAWIKIWKKAWLDEAQRQKDAETAHRRREAVLAATAAKNVTTRTTLAAMTPASIIELQLGPTPSTSSVPTKTGNRASILSLQGESRPTPTIGQPRQAKAVSLVERFRAAQVPANSVSSRIESDKGKFAKSVVADIVKPTAVPTTNTKEDGLDLH